MREKKKFQNLISEPKPSNVLRRDGFYVNLEESKAFIFRNQDDGGDGQKLKLVVVRAKHDILTQAKVKKRSHSRYIN